MKKAKVLIFFIVLLLFAATIFVRMSSGAFVPFGEEPETESSPSVPPSGSTGGGIEPVPPEDSAEPSPSPEPEPEHFTLSFVGDCTLNSAPKFQQSDRGYARTMNGDYAYPFSNTAEYFKDDDMTFANLECNFSDDPGLQSIEWFYFKVPTEWANILVEGNVDYVTTANNHMMDFGQAGADSTYSTLDEYGIPYGKEGEGNIYTTAGGLKIGIYCDYNDYFPEQGKCSAEIKKLREQGAEYVMCAFHWGKDELFYKPTDKMVDLAHACIDAGADLVYGSHTHCLQPVEEYNGGYIMYSMGNWSFGGHTSPSDPDTAIVQVDVRRDPDGSISNDGYSIIPCCISSDIEGAQAYWQAKQAGSSPTSYYNNYCPTPYPEDSEGYGRVMAKMQGTYEGPDGKTDYGWVATGGQQ